jgi:hypothetical protein
MIFEKIRKKNHKILRFYERDIPITNFYSGLKGER